jgi:hypothetical protein
MQANSRDFVKRMDNTPTMHTTLTKKSPHELILRKGKVVQAAIERNSQATHIGSANV